MKEGLWIRCLDEDGNVVAYAEGVLYPDRPMEPIECAGIVRVEVGWKLLHEMDRAIVRALEDS